MTYVRHCPRCQSARPLTEMVCLGTFQEAPCHWSLFDILPTPETSEPSQVSEIALITPGENLAVGERHCLNGHALEPGDFLCLDCGEPAVSQQEPVPSSPPADAASPVVKGWALGEELPVHSGESDLRLAQKEGVAGVFKHYRRGIEPESSLYPSLRALETEHGVRLLDSGRYENRPFEVWEYLPLGTLGDIPPDEKADPGFAREIVKELGQALHGLSRVNLIHRDLKPANVLVRSREPLDLVLSDFSTATVSEFDLQLTMSRQTTRYAAPETVAGTCSAASDWWSLGVMVLEILTKGRDFEGVHERAFLLHLVTRGLRVPDNLPSDWQELLKGLLTRDPSRRWNWQQVERWLQGESGIPNGYAEDNADGSASGITLSVGGRTWTTPESFALAAVESAHWDEALAILMSGRLATWLHERGGEKDLTRAAQVRDIAADTSLPEDAKLAAAVMVLNDNLPLCFRGEIITPNWILAHPDAAWEWLDSHLPQRLRRWEREAWFVKVRERADRVRDRRKSQKIACDEAQLAAAMLAISQSMLEIRWAERRRLYPEADHRALASMMERRTPTEEDLILLISASIHLFRPASDVLEEAGREAERAKVSFSPETMAAWFEESRASILDALDDRLRNFVRCDRVIPDQWADDFRQDRRISLARALVLLAIPEAEWCEPPRQEYVRNILHFFHRRLITGLQRGGLIRMTIGKTTARLDLNELGGPARSASALLNAILKRETPPPALDPTPLLEEPMRQKRLRRLSINTVAYRRDTGINPLYLGFPFIVLGDARASDAAKPRIAPVLLWPIRLDMPSGQRGSVKMAFDSEREIRPNPALEGLLGLAFSNWNETLNDLRSRDHLDIRTVMDAFSHLAEPATSEGAEDQLLPLPPPTVHAVFGTIQLHRAAVLFQCDFSGQTIAEDLKQLANGTPVSGTALEMAVRAAEPLPSPAPAIEPPELDRYFTAPSDPSQQRAVFLARNAPGLVVQGPPGTGKSQTIVNIVCDAIGRGERVLIVCQKQAALEVVRKRLDTEGLGQRLFYLRDATSDRRPALQQLREQLKGPCHHPNDSARLVSQREGLARHIEALEKDLNSAHQALHEAPADQPGRLSYREILDELLLIESSDSGWIAFPETGTFFREMDRAEAWQLISEMVPLGPLWLKSHWEESPLHDLVQFEADEPPVADFRRAFVAYQNAEKHREALLQQNDRFFSVDSPDCLQGWLAEHEGVLRSLSPRVARDLAQSVGRFPLESSPEIATLKDLLARFEELVTQLKALDTFTLDGAIFPKLGIRGDGPLRRLSRSAANLAEPPSSFFARLNPSRFFAKRRLNKWLRLASVDPDDVDLQTLHEVAELELALRKNRPLLNQWRDVLKIETEAQEESLPAMRALSRRLVESLQPVVETAKRVQSCPIKPVAKALEQAGEPAACASILDACHASLVLHGAERTSTTALEKLRAWFVPDWIQHRVAEIQNRNAVAVSLDAFADSISTLPAFQTYRLRAQSLNPAATAIFARLREKAASLEPIDPAGLPEALSHTLQREALREWKSQIEAAHPTLLIERDEFEQKVRLLSQQDKEIREANRNLLCRCAADAPLSPRNDWDDVVMLTGPRARRLREVVERGEPLGLFHLRPVWMVNPEMVSRLFPLRANLFDLVIFDEASQLPVENALPALFRARRVVVSGDEKQMPPSRFFGSHLDSDEEEESDSWIDADDASLDETERERLFQAAGRREVKDCPDLLTLTQNLLPSATLEIHYRSQYRQLIDFSNAAFYGNRLNVPARHPESEILRARPVEVDRVDGQYAEQTNEAEAARVVHRLQEIWRLPVSERPSIGVVTFNLKQADLIAQELETLAENDPEFRDAWIAESSRTQNGEDMGFFVKNLENVQGDERDWIIFSTTFGRDSTGTFRRNFGVLGQQGGERRLNVAVTRAREKVLLITSMPIAEVSNWSGQTGRRLPSTPRDFLQGWLTYAERLDAGDFEQTRTLLGFLTGQPPTSVPAQNKGSRTSRFMEEVAAFIKGLGHEPIPAQGDAFGVDFAIKHPQTGHFGLGIECDSHCHEMLATARARELWRPAVLAGSIKSIHRVSSREWYHRRTDEQNRLREALRPLELIKNDV